MYVAPTRCPGIDASSRLPGIGKILGLGEARVPEGLLGQPWALVCCPHPGGL